jgi:chromosomal replication initiator protein
MIKKTDAQTIWANCLEIIKPKLTEQSFTTWFLPIKPIKLNNLVLTIEVPTAFYFEWLEEYYVQLLKEAIDITLGPQGRLEYAVVIDMGNKKQAPLTINMLHSQSKPRESASVSEPAETLADKPSVGKENQPPHIIFSPLNKSYTFKTFVEGECNRFARSAALTVACNPGGNSSYSPMFIYGVTGVGKTHLVQAICNEVKARKPSTKIIYVTAEQFTQHYVESSKINQVQEFINLYRQAHVLVLDDVNYLTKRDKTQDTFFHIFNDLQQSNAQIIFTSDTPPRDMQGFNERLLSRFKWGLHADIKMPDFESRCEIIRAKAEQESLPISQELIQYLAYNAEVSPRELEGIVISLMANTSLMKRDLDIILLQNILSERNGKSEKVYSVEYIQKVVCEYFRLPHAEICGKSRTKDIAHARLIAMYFCQQWVKIPLKVIGEKFGGRDHSTVIHASKTIQLKMKSDKALSLTIDEISKRLKGL